MANYIIDSTQLWTPIIGKRNFPGVASSLKYLKGNYRQRCNTEGFEAGKEKIRVAETVCASSFVLHGKAAIRCPASGRGQPQGSASKAPQGSGLLPLRP